MDKNETLNYVASVVRALITSRKPPAELKSILRDYSDVEGHQLPYYKLGYRTAQDLLSDTNAFTFQTIWGEVCISAKYNAKSDHIASMVCKQRPSKSRALTARRPTAPSPRHLNSSSNFGGSSRGPHPSYNLKTNYPRSYQSEQQQKQHQQELHSQEAARLQQLREKLELKNQSLRREEEQQARLRREFDEERQRQEEKLRKEKENLAKEQMQLRQHFQKVKSTLEEKQRQVSEQTARGAQLRSLSFKEIQEEHEKLRVQWEELEEFQRRQQQKIEQERKKRMAEVSENNSDENISITIKNSPARIQKVLKTQSHHQQVRKDRENQLYQNHQSIQEEEPKQQVRENVERGGQSQEKRTVEIKETNAAENLIITVNKSTDGIENRVIRPSEEKNLIPIENIQIMNSKMNGHKNSTQSMRPILGNSAPSSGAPSYKGKQFNVVARSPSTSVNDRLKRNQMPTSPLTPPDTPQSASAKSAEKPSQPERKAQHQQKQEQSANSLKEKNTTKTKPQIMESPKKNQVLRRTVKFQFDPSIDPVTSLELYCNAHDLNAPLYQKFYNRNSCHCSVRIGANVYSSYPAEFPDEVAARQGTARIAIDRLTYLESRKHLTHCTLKDEDFLENLYQELLKYPNGILGHRLEQWYEETFKHLCPTHWYDLVSEFSKIRIEHGINPKIILYANPPGSQALRVCNATPNKTPELALPWLSEETASGQDWSMYITHCDSTQHVWARLIDHNSSFEILTAHMNQYMSIASYRVAVSQPKEHEIYLVEVSDIWNRVRVLEVDAERQTCRCHFVDFGDVVSFQYKDLYLCAVQFLSVASQAVCLSMYALEKFEDHPYAYDVLCKELAGQSVVARILTTHNQFLQLGGQSQGILEKGKRRACLVGTFYDTSTAEDIHLNDLVVKEITQSSRPPRLNLEQKSNPVLVSHINDMGDLMVLIRNDDLKFVERSIANTVSAGIDEQHRVKYTDLLRDNLVLVCDESAGADAPKQWYRGMLTAKPKSPEEESFDIYYVDDGRLRKTHISNIYRLEANNLALAAFPPQALRVRLHDVPPIDAQMLGSLRGLIPPRSEVLLKVMESGVSDKLPMVHIYIRGQDRNSMYLCVNSAIRMEYEMSSSARVNHFDDGGLHFNPNGQLLRRSSFSSVVSSHSSASSSTNTMQTPENGSVVQSTIASTPPVTPQKIVSIKDYEAIPAIGSYFEVRIALSINPARFAVQPYKCYNQFQNLMKDLQAHGKNAANQSVTQCIIGRAYAAPDADNVYHRVTVQQIYDEIVHVRFVDLGDDGVLAKQQLKVLPMAMQELPKMAIPAQLYGIQLADIIWTQENCRRFRELTLGQKFIAFVRGYNKVKDETRVVNLELIDTSTPQDIKLHEILINEKHAKASDAS